MNILFRNDCLQTKNSTCTITKNADYVYTYHTFLIRRLGNTKSLYINQLKLNASIGTDNEGVVIGTIDDEDFFPIADSNCSTNIKVKNANARIVITKSGQIKLINLSAEELSSNSYIHETFLYI